MYPSAQAFAADSCSDLLVFLLDMNNAPFVIDSVFISLSLIKGAYQSGGGIDYSQGSSAVKVIRPSFHSAQIFPPWALATVSAMESPKPKLPSRLRAWSRR